MSDEYVDYLARIYGITQDEARQLVLVVNRIKKDFPNLSESQELPKQIEDAFLKMGEAIVEFAHALSKALEDDNEENKTQAD